MKFLEKTSGFMKALWKDEAGQGLVEYGLILALVAVGIIATLIAMKDELDGIFDYISQQLSGGNPTNTTTE
jgi:pilus assembly protein Flp/PilA